MNIKKELEDIYDLLYSVYGPQHWWPGETRDEIIIGAILTQHTNWKNAAKAINNLKKNDLVSLKEVTDCSMKRLASLIRSSGYYNQKAKRLKAIAECINNDDSFEDTDLCGQRTRLLSIKGIGQETADSILLYAYQQPVFVIDTYTKRIFSRLGFFKDCISYDISQDFFMKELEHDVQLFNEYHALLVKHAKEYCQKNPQCANCPLSNKCNARDSYDIKSN